MHLITIRNQVCNVMASLTKTFLSVPKLSCRNVVEKRFHQCVPDSACRQAELLRNGTNISNLQRLELRPKKLCATALHDTAQPCNRFLHFDLCTTRLANSSFQRIPSTDTPSSEAKAFNASIPSLRTWRRKGSTPPLSSLVATLGASRTFPVEANQKKQLIKAKRDTNLEPEAALTSFML